MSDLRLNRAAFTPVPFSRQVNPRVAVFSGLIGDDCYSANFQFLAVGDHTVLLENVAGIDDADAATLAPRCPRRGGGVL